MRANKPPQHAPANKLPVPYRVAMSKTATASSPAATSDLPKWDMTPYFSGLDDPTLDAAIASLDKDLNTLQSHFDTHHVGDTAANDDRTITAADVTYIVKALNKLGDDVRVVRAYINAFITVDSRNELAQQRMSALEPLLTRFGTLGTRATAWMGAIDVDALAQESDVIAEHQFALGKMKTEASKLMAPAEEALAAQLAETGGNAWAKLHGNFTSQIEVQVQGDTLPMSAVRNLAFERDASLRKAGYDAELAAWKHHELVIASAMNSVKGEASLLNRKRGWGGLLDESLFRANMDREALDAMLDAARDAFPVFRRYLRAKARMLGHEAEKGLPFYDLFAPVGESADWTYAEAAQFIERHFRGYSDKLADFTVRNFEENWVDAAPAPGKRDGAFCMSVRSDESRILMNFKPAFGSVATLAHELGHGYHNLCLASRTMLQRTTPMTLAETASIFCETIIKRAALRETDGQERLAILEASLQGATQIVVDITSRFEFETNIIDGRQQRELSAREMCEIMREAQLNTYGEGLDPDALHPYMWAAKPHYYAWRSFYNFPYMFGMLFGLGLYAIYQNEPNGFHDRYDDLLSSTGLDDAATLANRFGINIRDKQFWADSLRVIAEDVEQFESFTS